MDFALRRWIVLAAGILIQAILGGVYAWSLFSPELMQKYQISSGQSGLIFGLIIGIFSMVTIPGGWMLKRYGARATASLGAVLFSLGYIIAHFSGGNFWLLLLGVSIVGGAGTGLGYVCPLSVGMQWFPNQKGLITGVSVAGFGGGAILLSEIAGRFLASGTPVLDIFLGIALIPGAIYFLAASVMSSPKEYTPAVTGYNVSFAQSLKESLAQIGNRVFLLHTLGIFAGTFSGLLVIGNLVPLALSQSFNMETAALGVSLFAVGNAVGRIVWGYISDHFKYLAIPMSLAFFALLLLFLPQISHFVLFYKTTFLLGFGFGANFVVYASSLSRHFGTAVFPQIYPLVFFLGYGVAGVTGPFVGGMLADWSNSFHVPVYMSALMGISATVFLFPQLRKVSHREARLEQ